MNTGASPRTVPPASAPLLGTSAQIVIGLAAGVLLGLFVGERTHVLQPVADIYIRLMQMTVLPYVVVTLIGGLGRLDADMARRLGWRALVLAALLAGFGLLVIALMPLTFPSLESASFYSDALVSPRQPFEIGEIYVPANPFHAMANAVVPAVVLFSSALGVALIGVPGKAPLLASLKALEDAVVRVTRFVLRLTPWGVFAISASIAGTMDADAAQRLEVYFVAFVAASGLLAFVVLPLIVSALTPFGYREVLRMGKDAMLTAFVASSAFIVLPMLVERVREALAARALDRPQPQAAIDVVIPVSFVVPNAGKLLTLLFVPYASWLAGAPLELAGYVELFAVGLPSYFAKAQVALPFLMDLVDAPHDLFQLYIPASILTGKFDSMVTVMSLLALALLSAVAVDGGLRVSWHRIAPRLALVVGLTAATVLVVRLLLGVAVDTTYDKDELLREMHLSRARLPIVLHTEPPPVDAAPGTALQRIRERGVLRVAFAPGRVPLSFVNARGDLVGMDVELAEQLAEALGVKAVEFYPAHLREMARLVAAGRVDIGMGMPYVAEALPLVAYSPPYLDSTVGFVVRDRDRHAFATVDGIRSRGRVRIGVTADAAGFEALLRAGLPGVTMEFVPLSSPREFLTDPDHDLDAMALLAESGAAWAILHPEFSVVVPQPHPIGLPVGIAMRRGDRDLADFIGDWSVVVRSSGLLAEMRQYWILGRGAEAKRRRWSVMDDVLGWGTPAPAAGG